MNRWTGLWVAVVSCLALTACGSVEGEDATESSLGRQEQGIDVCGNGICMQIELTTCPQDCGYGGYCGDGTCTAPETTSTCSSDCRPGGGCFAPGENDLGGPIQTIDVCGNGICTRIEPVTCPQDCPYDGYCGDRICTWPETSSTCPADCRSGC